jgi:hypothetical protein
MDLVPMAGPPGLEEKERRRSPQSAGEAAREEQRRHECVNQEMWLPIRFGVIAFKQLLISSN